MTDKKFLINTYGCQMNTHESEKLSGMLKSLGYSECEKVEDADCVVFNTCCIRKSAEDKIMGNIGALKQLKKEKPNMIIAVCGCMTQQQGMPDELLSKFKFIDIIFGTQNFHKFADFIREHDEKQKKIIEIVEDDKTVYENIPIDRHTKFNAYVNIMYGCNNFCTYCIVPYVRGREKSREADKIVEEVENILKSGEYQIITLLGQNVNSYGKDLKEKITFAQLLDRLALLPYNYVLKFLTSHPKDLTEDLIDIMAKHDNISHAIHLPVQSGSNKILKAMNRNYTREHYLDLVKMIKEKLPDVALTSDIIVGFPDETEKDFEDTCSLIKEVEFNSIYAFMYSPREGTPAATFKNQIPQNVKNERLNKLLNLEKEIATKNMPKLIGKTERVLIEKEIIKENIRHVMTVMDCGKTILVQSDTLQIGKFAKIKITDIVNNQLIGIELE